MAQSTITIGLKWRKHATDCRECSNCNDVIYSDMYIMYLEHSKIERTEYVLCKSCFDTLNIKADNEL